jgi:hypothetical protein
MHLISTLFRACSVMRARKPGLVRECLFHQSHGWLCALALLPLAGAEGQTGFSKLIAWGQAAASIQPMPPGNSLPHINFCYGLEYDGVELDIALSKDDIPVLSHGVNINGTYYDTKNWTFAELQQFALGFWQGSVVRIPRLADALATNGTRGPFLADMRVDGSMAWAVSNAVAEARFDERLLFITAYGVPRGLVYKQTFPRARIFVKYYLYPADISRSEIDAIAMAGLDGIMLQMPNDDKSIQEFTDYLHCKGLRLTLFVHYALGTFPELQRMVDAGTDYILTVHPEMRNQISWLQPDPQMPTLVSSPVAGRGLLSLSWQHQRPYPHRLQSSPDVAHWTDAVLPLHCTNAPLSVTGQAPINAGNRFYRLYFTP